MIWVWLCVVFAVIAVPISLLGYDLHGVRVANALLVVGGTLVVLLHVSLARRAGNPLMASLVWPLLLFRDTTR